MASSVNHRIVIEAANQLGDVTRLEAVGAAIITPGELLELTSTGTIQLHSAAAGTLEQGKIFALETQTPDDEDEFSIDVDYASGDTVYYVQAKAGDVINAFLANGQTAAITDLLVSDGAGALNVATVDANLLAGAGVGSPLAALNNATGSPARIQVRIV